MAMLLSRACLVTALVTFLPGASSAGHDSVVLGVCFAVLFAVFAGAVVRGIALVSHGLRVQGDVMSQWFALRCLPPAVQAAPAGLFVVGVVLLAGTVAGHDSRRAGEAENGRYYASQDDGSPSWAWWRISPPSASSSPDRSTPPPARNRSRRKEPYPRPEWVVPGTPADRHGQSTRCPLPSAMIPFAEAW
ncbi:hypothetical protein [Actinacidiphila glaucinigra]|uniref:hypothetical protein n=1 Tax=Actinacidiphila glaucinigra TaxID=235986 RepID=UPI003802F3D5